MCFWTTLCVSLFVVDGVSGVLGPIVRSPHLVCPHMLCGGASVVGLTLVVVHFTAYLILGVVHVIYMFMTGGDADVEYW